MTQLGLTWVLVDGRPRAVSEFAGVPPRRRPAATCPACGHRLTLKLGRVRRHHAAHAPDALCATTRPETALHFDVKLALAAARSRAIVRERPAPVESWGSFVFASRPSVASIGVDAELTHDGAVAILAPDTGSTAGERRALAILVSAASEEEVRRVDRRLRDGGVATLWLSHPLDWSSSRADLAWAPAGRDGRGRTVVVIDGLGIYRADAFVRAFRRGEPRLAPGAVKRRMADRVAALRSRTTDG